LQASCASLSSSSKRTSFSCTPSRSSRCTARRSLAISCVNRLATEEEQVSTHSIRSAAEAVAAIAVPPTPTAAGAIKAATTATTTTTTTTTTRRVLKIRRRLTQWTTARDGQRHSGGDDGLNGNDNDEDIDDDNDYDDDYDDNDAPATRLLDDVATQDEVADRLPWSKREQRWRTTKICKRRRATAA
jgi:hypothetical protein